MHLRLGTEGILTFDIGTTGVKTSVFGVAGTELASVSVAYQTWYPRAGHAEQDADDFWTAAVQGARRLFALPGLDPGCVLAIGVSGHMNGCLPVDAEGRPLCREIIHSDSRSGPERDAILDACPLGDFHELTGNRADPHLSLPKILWLRNHLPDLYRSTAFFINSKDFVVSRLTGTVGLTDFSDASLTVAMDIRKKVWAEGLLRDLGLDSAKFPRIARSGDRAGGLTAEAAALLGLAEGTPVAVGGGDAACATRGAGITDDSRAYCCVGSSAWMSTLAKEPLRDPLMRMQNFYDLDGELCNVCGTVQSASIALDWARRELGGNLAADAGGRDLYAHMAGLVRLSPPGSHGLLFFPCLMGERTPWWDEAARGAFIGMSLHHTQADILRAIHEGVAHSLKTVLGIYDESGFPRSELTLLGGGALNEAWVEILCDVLDRRLRIHAKPLSATSLGAAMAAGVAVGVYPDYAAASAIATLGQVFEPDPARAGVHRKYHAVWSVVYERLKPVFDGLAAIESENQGKEGPA